MFNRASKFFAPVLAVLLGAAPAFAGVIPEAAKRLSGIHFHFNKMDARVTP